jgi:osmotically-inducible protein OsmY
VRQRTDSHLARCHTCRYPTSDASTAIKTDAELKHDILAELTWEPWVDVARIGVAVLDGVVTLVGLVDRCASQWAVESAVRRIPGVRALDSAMAVALPPADRREDADIARAVENALRWMTLLPADAVRVRVEHGWIMLSGEVDWDYQRQAVTDVVRCLVGVAGVSDGITVVHAA